ncbi:hypothetical protein BDQ12DRAFT_324268 [Crucibulum laeve]|uniref:Uncharacterized protein n=1 Tax=Crucibulum laeve TaxID=68775 RepID=A0A5C3LQV0_9AGAR|nr:hypothetical protein BDQ12DRAFT_324268 [Crucibulum laeve]
MEVSLYNVDLNSATLMFPNDNLAPGSYTAEYTVPNGLPGQYTIRILRVKTLEDVGECGPPLCYNASRIPGVSARFAISAAVTSPSSVPVSVSAFVFLFLYCQDAFSDDCSQIHGKLSVPLFLPSELPSLSTRAASPASCNTSPTQSNIVETSKNAGKPTGAIVGGAASGLAVIALIFALISRRRKHLAALSKTHSDPMKEVFLFIIARERGQSRKENMTAPMLSSNNREMSNTERLWQEREQIDREIIALQGGSTIATPSDHAPPPSQALNVDIQAQLEALKEHIRRLEAREIGPGWSNNEPPEYVSPLSESIRE